jgi:hypothetical protein
MLGLEPTTIPISTEAMKSNLLQLQNDGQRFKPAMTGTQSGRGWSCGGTKRPRQSTGLAGCCTCKGTIWTGSRNRLLP